MSNQNEGEYDIFNEENSNEVNEEFKLVGRTQSVNQTLHFDNRFRRDGQGNIKEKFKCRQEELKNIEVIDSSSSIEVIINPKKQRFSVKMTKLRDSINKEKYRKLSKSFDEFGTKTCQSRAMIRKLSSSKILSSIKELSKATKNQYE